MPPPLSPELDSRLRRDLLDSEGSRLFPYRDTKGFLTIGVGHNLDAKGISERVQEILLEEDIADTLEDLDRHLAWWRRLDPVRQLVIVELCFNMGIGEVGRTGLRSFTQTLPLIREGHYDQAARNLARSKWARDVGPRRTARVLETLRTGR